MIKIKPRTTTRTQIPSQKKYVERTINIGAKVAKGKSCLPRTSTRDHEARRTLATFLIDLLEYVIYISATAVLNTMFED